MTPGAPPYFCSPIPTMPAMAAHPLSPRAIQAAGAVFPDLLGNSMPLTADQTAAVQSKARMVVGVSLAAMLVGFGVALYGNLK